MELLGMLNGEENHLLKLLLNLLKSTDVLPLDVGDLDNCLSEGRGVDLSHCKLEMVLTNSHSFQDSSIDLLILNINDIHLLSDALEG